MRYSCWLHHRKKRDEAVWEAWTVGFWFAPDSGLAGNEC